MRIKITAALVCLLMLCAFMPVANIEEASVPRTAPSALEQPARQSMVFLVDTVADNSLRDGAVLYANKVEELTDGYLTIEVRNSARAVADYQAGGGEITFVDSRRDSDFCAEFATLSAPMRYKDYDTFTMGLNSKKMLNMLNDVLESARGTMLLAAYYQGSNYLVSARPLAEGAVARQTPALGQSDPARDEEEEEDAEAPLALLRTDHGLARLLVDCDLEVRVEFGQSARLYQLMDGTADLAEFTLDEMNAIDWRDTGVNLLAANHSAAPCWLAVDRGRYDSFPPKYRAALVEAAAYLFPVIDDAYRARETQMLEHVRAQGVTAERSFPALRSAADALAQSEAVNDRQKKYLLGILSGME